MSDNAVVTFLAAALIAVTIFVLGAERRIDQATKRECITLASVFLLWCRRN